MPSFKGILSFIWDIAKIIVISLLIIIPIRYFVAQPFFVRGASMESTYYQGDYLIVDEVTYRFNDPVRGDVIIFKFPQDTSQFFIKRILALPSETISIKNSVVTIVNDQYPGGFVLEEDYLNSSTSGDLEIRLDDNEYFVMGDNRPSSHDSRRWGPLNKEFIIGRVFLRAWPVSQFEIIDTPVYNSFQL